MNSKPSVWSRTVPPKPPSRLIEFPSVYIPDGLGVTVTQVELEPISGNAFPQPVSLDVAKQRKLVSNFRLGYGELYVLHTNRARLVLGKTQEA